MTPQQEARIAEALRHVEMGFAVMSVWSTEPDGTCKCQKPHADKKSRGKHPIPRDGFKAASRDPKMVTAMLSAGSEPNYGIVWPEGDDVVFEWDVDGEDWKSKIADLKAQYGPLPPTKTTRSPSGGLHVFYRWPKGIPVPDGNHFHGFIVRWPWKGYVVGPGSRINGTAYTDVGATEIATLPPSWAVTAPVASDRPLIVVAGTDGGYELPKSIGTGSRHDEIAKYVASRWNRGITKAEVAASVRAVLVPLFDDLMDDHRLAEEIEHAWDTCVRKWKEPTSVDEVIGTQTLVSEDGQTESSTQQAIDPLAMGSQIDRPEPLDIDNIALPAGLVGLVSHYEPFTDASWSSLLLGSCVVMSALVGPNPTLRWRQVHRASLFGVLVGDSNWGRKTQVLNEVEAAFKQVDGLMLDEITKSGIASPEKLVDILKDARTNAVGSLLIREDEVTNMMVIAGRDGNNMSGYLRMAWDGRKLETHSRSGGSVVATGYAASILGGVVPKSLRVHLSPDDVANGWANRFLWFHAEPRAGGMDSTADTTMSKSLIDWLSSCIEHARRLGGAMLIRPQATMSLDPAALAYMEAMAARLDVPPVGTIGVLRQRMPGHVIRLAMVAALFDRTATVTLDHVLFGEAMADYAVESMRPVFGVRVDDPVAMMILGVLKDHGWQNTSTIRALVGGKDYTRVVGALRTLLADGLILREDRAPGPKGGRPAVGYRVR